MQYFFMIPNIIYGKAIGITSGVMVRKIGADVWTSMLIGFFIGIIVIALLTFLCSRFPEQSIIQYSQVLLGKWMGKAIGLVLACFFVVAFAVSADVMVLHLKEYFLFETPVFVICLIYVLLCMYGARLGFEVVVRLSLIGFLMLLLLNITMFLGVIKDFDFLNLQPIMDKGIVENTTNSVYVFSDLAMAILAIGMIYPTLDNKKKSGSITFWAMILTIFMVVIWPFLEIGVLGPNIMSNYVVCCMEQIRSAQFTKYLPRYELMMVSFFVFTILVQSTAMLHCAKYSVKQITGIKKEWPILAPITLIGLVLTYYLVADDNHYVDFLSYPWSQICAILGIGLPLLLFLVALFRGKLKKQA